MGSEPHGIPEDLRYGVPLYSLKPYKVVIIAPET